MKSIVRGGLLASVSIGLWLTDTGGVVRIVPAALAQEARPRSPLDMRDPAFIESGKALFATLCASCHGPNARGGEAADLFKSRVVRQESPGPLAGVIKNGLPGTGMAPQQLVDYQVFQLVAFLRNLTQPALQPPAPGDPEAGRAIFAKIGCGGCHMVSGRGGVVGPDLSSIAFRNRLEQIRESILDPNARIANRFRSVTITLKKGRQVTGILKNEDNFSIQLQKLDGRFALVDRKDIAALDYKRESLMPAEAGKRLDEDQLRDLLAYLDRQRAPSLSFDVNFQNY